MMRNFKALGLAMVAALALSAVAAASASAQPAHFTAGSDTGKITITDHPDTTEAGIQFFETTSGMIECHEFHGQITYDDGVNGTEIFTEATIENIEYNECFLGGLEAEVNFDGCDYHLSNAEWVQGAGTMAGHARSDVQLGPGGCAVTITDLIIGCEVTVNGAQLFEDSLTYTNVNTGVEELTIHAETETIEYEAGALCPDPGEKEGGVYEGTLTAKAFNTAGGQVPLTATAT